MISAKEAREKIDDLKTEKGQQEKKKAEEKITKAIENGEFSCKLDPRASHGLKKYLRSLGYNIEDGGDLKDGFYTKVSW